MYSWDKSLRGGDKSKKQQIMNPPLSSTTLPSFSSTLLDEIYDSIDAGDRTFETRDQRNTVKDELETNNRSQRAYAYRVEKWIENKDHHHDKISTRRRQSLPDYDRAFFTSSWSSSDSSSGGETEYKRRSSSCFTGAPNSIPARTTNNTMEKTPKLDSRNHDQDSEAKSKLRALKMYNNLKKGKQPISPGIRLTSFLNSLFTRHHGNSKKSTKQSNDDRSSIKPRQPLSSSISTCSSSSSYHRSCLIANKTSSVNIVNPEEKKPIKNNNNGAKRRVRFEPVIVDDDDDGSVSSDISSDLFELDHLVFMGSYDRDYNEELPVYETTRPVGSNSKHGRRIIY